MKVSKLFHWLYASVMFIPLLIIPILGLAVRSDNNFQPMSVEVPQYEKVDFNQLVPNQYINGFTNSVIDSRTFINLQIQSRRNQNYTATLVNLSYDTPTTKQGIFTVPTASGNSNQIQFVHNGLNRNIEFTGLIPFTFSTNDKIYWKMSVISNNPTIVGGIQLDNIQLINLTQMFGFGNEPTLEDFITYYPNNYYDYVVSKQELLFEGNITYSDSDVGSQMVYTLYKATDKYFNFNQFLGIGNLYNWFQLNVFNGNAPLGFTIFWNLLIYWLLVSIAWLIFDIAMFVPKLAHRWLDKASLE